MTALATHRPLVLAAVMAANFMIAIEATIVSTAMPQIVAQLGGLELYSWVFAAFLLTQTATTVVFGKLSDLKGRKVVIPSWVVAGSGLVKKQAEAEGLDKIFREAGFEWREPGCSMCLAMNPDKLKPEERCASTSNRNFEGRQGFKGRTHLVSPAMAAAAAIAGHFVDIREWR